MKKIYKDLIRPYVPFTIKYLNKILKYKNMTISNIEPTLEDFYANIISNLQHNVIIDAGSFVGDYCFKIKKKITKDLTFHLFEPFEPSFNQLKIFAENEKQLVINNTALSDNLNNDELYVYGLPKTNSMFMLNHLENDGLIKKEGKRKIRCITLDQYCLKNNITGIDILHMDVNGAEKLILSGSKKLLESMKIESIEIDFILNSYYSNAPKFYEIVEFLNSFNYSLKNIGSITNIIDSSNNFQTEELKLFFVKN
tara:strand:- start:27 stop:788 length:762 start_codon:yes stop_codon:yes gene_type:complete